MIGEFVVQRLHSIQQACNSGNSFFAEELRVTNSMLFRVYLENYIRQMGKSNPDMLYMVRYLPMAERGLPVELYLFSAEKTWSLGCVCINHREVMIYNAFGKEQIKYRKNEKF